MKQVWNNHLFLWKLCFSVSPGYMLYFLFDGFRQQMVIFLEHTVEIGRASCRERVFGLV